MSTNSQCSLGSNLLDNTSHIRRNALTGEYILVSPHRALRPWSGQVEDSKDKTTRSKQETSQQHDSDTVNNPLAPGGIRGNGVKNPDYKVYNIK